MIASASASRMTPFYHPPLKRRTAYVGFEWKGFTRPWCFLVRVGLRSLRVLSEGFAASKHHWRTPIWFFLKSLFQGYSCHMPARCENVKSWHQTRDLFRLRIEATLNDFHQCPGIKAKPFAKSRNFLRIPHVKAIFSLRWRKFMSFRRKRLNRNKNQWHKMRATIQGRIA